MARALLLIPVVALFAAVLAGGHWVLYQRLVVDAELPAHVEGAFALLIAGLGLSLVLQPAGERMLRPPWQRWLAWPASLWMGIAFLLLVALGFSELLASVVAAVAPVTGEGAARWRAGAVVSVALMAGGLALRNGLAPPRVRRVEIELARWPAALDGLRIVQISDIHIGPLLDRRFAAAVTRRVLALQPDLVAVTGDLVDGRADLLRDEVAPFGGLRAPLGVYFVTGNHDHYSGARAWSEEARRLGMRVLRNEHVVLESRGERFVVAGVDDHHAGWLPDDGREDLDAALAGIAPQLPVLLLAHDPSTFKRASEAGIDLQLSGHTHGGQIWPFRWLVRAAIPFVEGLHQRGRARLYVSRGTGFWGPPMRLGAPSEITEIVLRARQTSSSS